MDARAFQPVRPGAMPRGPPHMMPARPLRAADQGPFDWLVPFIPPFLRVNRATREKIWDAIVHALSPEATKLAAERVLAFLKDHGSVFAKWSLVVATWIAGLIWVQLNAQELATAYVILSAFIALCIHVVSGDTTAATDVNGEKISAYSVFNKGARRMMGSLSAEQFEVHLFLVNLHQPILTRGFVQNEIRHRGPGHNADNDRDDIGALRAQREAPISDDEEADP
jgi:hypothetical protein